MSLFRVAWEEDMLTIKEPGVTQTEFRQYQHFYVSDTFETVWSAIGDIRNDPEKRRRLISVTDCSVGVTILTDRDST